MAWPPSDVKNTTREARTGRRQVPSRRVSDVEPDHPGARVDDIDDFGQPWPSPVAGSMSQLHARPSLASAGSSSPALRASSPSESLGKLGVAPGGAVLVEAHDEWQVGEPRYLSEGSTGMLARPTADQKEVATPALLTA